MLHYVLHTRGKCVSRLPLIPLRPRSWITAYPETINQCDLILKVRQSLTSVLQQTQGLVYLHREEI